MAYFFSFPTRNSIFQKKTKNLSKFKFLKPK